MFRRKLNIILDIAAFVAFLALSVTGVLMYYVLPPGSGKVFMIWGMDRHGWGNIHFWVSVIFFSIVTLHLFLHGRWFLTLFREKTGEYSGLRAGLGFTGLFVLLLIVAAPFLAPVEKVPPSERSVVQGGEEHAIRGDMTLREVEESTGVPSAVITEKLGLPSDTSPDEKLGQLKKRYGFSINDVRTIVEENTRK